MSCRVSQSPSVVTLHLSSHRSLRMAMRAILCLGKAIDERDFNQPGADVDCTLRSRSASGCCFAFCRERWLSPLFLVIHAKKKQSTKTPPLTLR